MTELSLQVFTAQFLTLSAADSVMWYAVPNGEYRSKRTGAKLKRMGVRAGVPDFALVLPGGQAAFLELKTPKGRLSKAQKDLRPEIERSGAYYEVADTSEQVIGILRAWGAVRRSVAVSGLEVG